MSKAGAFATGLIGGYLTGDKLRRERERDQREQEIYGLKKQDLELGLARKKREEETTRSIEDAGKNAFQQEMTGMAPQPTEEGAEPTDYEPVGGMVQTGTKNPFGRKGAMVAGAEAMAAEAMRHGRLDLAQQHLQGASALRTQLRAEVGGEALRQYQTTGDSSGLVNFYNKLVPDGGQVESVRRIRDEKGNSVNQITAVRDGARVTRNLSDDELTRQVALMTDPQKSLEADRQMAQARLLKQWEWATSPETRAGGFKERKAKTDAEESRAKIGLYGAESKAYNALAEARSKKSDNTELTPRQKNQLSRDLSNMIDRELSPTATTNAAGIKETIPHPLRGYSDAIKSRAEQLIFNEGDTPNSAMATAMREVRQRVEGLTDQVDAAYQLSDKERGWLSGDKPLQALQRGIAALEAAGYRRSEIKEAAKRLGRDPAEVDRAMQLAPAKTKPIGGAPGLEPGSAPSAGRKPLSAFGG